MTHRLQLVLLSIVVATAGTDFVWVNAGHFDVDAKGFGLIALLTLVCAAGAAFYEHVRKDERLSAMLAGTSFLLGMSASFSLLNYLLLTVAGTRIDMQLAAVDRAMGVDWPAMMAFVAHYPVTNAALQLIYLSVLPQIALLIVTIGLWGKPNRIYSLVLSVAFGAAISIAVWTAAPSFGAFSVYQLPASVSEHLAVALDGRYAKELIALLAQGPGYVSPTDAKGLIGFPSYHAALALIVVWQARELPVLRWVLGAVNAVVLVATPIQGGHHVVDVIAGAGVAAVAVLLADRIVRPALKARNPVILGPEPATR
ncbi:MAG TPA: phosphatase PAP2 family protein [Rhizomicrobium sp.]|nr:phosphatase PAP2 family protein [Rhizomicrobium sp.]